MLGHSVSNRGIEVDKAKIEVIGSLPSPKCVKDIRSLGEGANKPLMFASWSK